MTGRSIAGRNIWIIGMYYAPDRVGIAPYTTQLAEYLHTRGAHVQVTTGISHYPEWEAAPAHRRTLSRREVINGVPVRRLRHTVPRRMTALRRGLYEFSFLVHVLSRRPPFRPDLVLAVTPALSSAIAAAVLARRLRVPLMVIVQDLTGPGAVQSGIVNGAAVARLTEFLERWTLRQASCVTVLHPRFSQYVLEAGVPQDRLHVVRNWSYAVPAAKPREQVRAELGWPQDCPVALYAGNLGLKMGLGNVVEAARLAEAREEKILFVLLGDGDRRRELERAAAGLSKLRFAGSRYGHDYADVLAAADVLLINEALTVDNMSLPSKLTYYFTSGRPVLAAVAPFGTTALEVGLAGGGVVVEPGSPELLLDAVLDLASDEQRCRALGEAGRGYAASAYDRDVLLARYEELIARTISQADEAPSAG